MIVQPCRGVRTGTRIAHKLLYMAVDDSLKTEVRPRRAEACIQYAALVSQVELLAGGELMHGCSRKLSDRGWGLTMEIKEQDLAGVEFVALGAAGALTATW